MKIKAPLLATSLLALNMVFGGATFAKRAPMVERPAHKSALTLKRAGDERAKKKMNLVNLNQLIISRTFTDYNDSVLVHLRGARVIIEGEDHTASEARDLTTQVQQQWQDTLGVGALAMEELGTQFQPLLDSLTASDSALPTRLTQSVEWTCPGGMASARSVERRVEMTVHSGRKMLALNVSCQGLREDYTMDEYVRYFNDSTQAMLLHYLQNNPQKAIWVIVGAAHAKPLKDSLMAHGIPTAILQVWQTGMSPVQFTNRLEKEYGPYCSGVMHRYNDRINSYDLAFYMSAMLEAIKHQHKYFFVSDGEHHFSDGADALLMTSPLARKLIKDTDRPQIQMTNNGTLLSP